MPPHRPALVPARARPSPASFRVTASHVAVCAALSLGVALFTGPSDGAAHLVAVLVVSAVGFGFAAAGAWKHRWSLGRAGGLIVLALASWLIGSAGWDVNILVFDKEPFPSWTDAFFLLAYPAMMAAAIVVVRRRDVRRDVAALIDASMITVGLGVVAYTFVIADAVADDSVGRLARVVGVVYPLSDVLVAGVVARLLVGSAAKTRAGLLLVSALGSLLVADVAFLASIYAGVAGNYDQWIDAPYMMFFLLTGLSLQQTDIVSLVGPSGPSTDRLGLLRTVSLGTGALLAPLTLMVGSVAGDVAKVRGAAVGAVLLFLLAMARMSLLMGAIETKRLLLEVLARTDALTGLPNRRTFDFEFDRAVEAARADLLLGCVSVAMIDLDHFKAFNDTYGHAAGDQLLHQAAAAWAQELHESAPGAMLARYGGEEFAAILPGIEEAAAAAVVARLLPSTPQGQSFSAGIAQARLDEAPSGVLARADQRLYQAKAGGRGVVVAGVPPGPPVSAAIP